MTSASSLEVILAVINGLQMVALAWIASRQQQVKGELQRTNGAVASALARLEDEAGTDRPPARHT